MSSIPHSKIAEALNVTRQHVSSLVKRGLPTTSLESARAWYHNNVRSRCSTHRPRAFVRPVLNDDLSPELEDWLFGSEKNSTKPDPIKLVDLPDIEVRTDAEVEAWMDSKVETVESAIQVAGLLVQVLRLHIDWMPHVMAERVNPANPDLARRELERWVETLNRECFTDHEQDGESVGAGAK